MKKRILVLDDDTSVLEMIEEVLVYEKYEVFTASAFDSVTELIEKYNPDLILLDCLLAEKNGGEICYEIKADPKTAHIPVVLISGYPKVIMSLGGIYNADEFLSKPFDVAELLYVVRKFLAQDRPLSA